MRELFLHVGMHKTGTTSIQRTLHAHGALLQEHGYSWFAGADANHSRVIRSAFSREPHRYHLNRRHGLDQAAAATYAAESRDQLLQFLASAPGPRLILSGEGIGLLQVQEIRQMLAAFRPLVDRITVIGFVRPPRSYIASDIGQRIYGGATLAKLIAKPVAPLYRKRFGAFIGASQVAQVRLHPFTPEALYLRCSVATFLRLIDAPDTLYPKLEVARVNASGSHLARVLALAANEALPLFRPDGTANPDRPPSLSRMLDTLEGPRFAVPEALIAPGLLAAAEDIAWMEAQLGIPFAEGEKRPGNAAPDATPRMLDWQELQVLVGALGRLVSENERLRATRRAEHAREAPHEPGQSDR